MSDDLYNKAINYMQYGETSKAIKCLEKAVFNGHLHSILELGSIYAERGDVEAAIVIYSQGIAQHDCHVCMYNKATLMIYRQKLEHAQVADAVLLLVKAYQTAVSEVTEDIELENQKEVVWN